MVVAMSLSVYKKTSPNGKVTLYIPKREVVDHYTHIDPIDGVLVVDPEYFKNRLIYGQVIVSLRYGREEDQVMGLEFSKDIYLVSEQVHPTSNAGRNRFTGSRIHERLQRKLGPFAIPFHFELPANTPSSVTIQQGLKDQQGPPCGVEYELKFYVTGDSSDDRGHKRSTVSLGIRKVQFAPMSSDAESGQRGTIHRPCTIVRKDFLLSPGQLELEVGLQKQLYYHGEDIGVQITIRNHSNKIVKKIRVSIVQMTDINLFSNGQYKMSVASLDTQDGCPINPSSSLQKVIVMTPSLDENNRGRRGVALDGQLKHQDTNLASSTLSPDPDEKDSFGIFISYVTKVKLFLGALGGELNAELPFLLMHPKPSPKKQLLKCDSQAEVEQIISSRQNTIDESIDEDVQLEVVPRTHVVADDPDHDVDESNMGNDTVPTDEE